MAKKAPPKYKDRVGERFGRLVCIAYGGPDKLGNAKWVCRCDCGQELTVIVKSLKIGHTISCGCYRREVTSRNSTTHGHSRPGRMTGEYRSWMSMKQRCTNVNHSDYKDYGAVGIFVCQRWLDSFQNFLDDMGLKPSEIHSLDRWPNQAGGYEPGNCRWATPKEQANNVKDNHLLTCNGKTQTISLWATEVGLLPVTLLMRIRRKWPIEKALFLKEWSEVAWLTPAQRQERANARYLVNREVSHGRLPPVKDLSCLHCGKSAKQYHHHKGYSKKHRLNVIPLCFPCHGKESDREQQPM